MFSLFRRRKARYVPRHLDLGKPPPPLAIGPATRYENRRGAYGNDWPTIVIDTNAPVRHFTGTKPRPRA